jgi:hypothetical protein
MHASPTRFTVVFLLLLLIAKDLRATENACARPYTIMGALEILVGFEKRLDEAAASIDHSVHHSGIPIADQSKASAERHAQIAAIRVKYEQLSDAVLEADAVPGADAALVANFESQIEELESQLMGVSRTVVFAKPSADIAPLAFSDVIEKPSLLKANTHYEVPVANTITGVASAHKLSVNFAPEVLDYFTADSQRGSRFLRAIQKGYVPSGSGSGIVRITDQHEKLVEVKVIGGNEGHQRLIGCRQGDGTIAILKVYEKRNEGGGGSLKRFASLCD